MDDQLALSQNTKVPLNATTVSKRAFVDGIPYFLAKLPRNSSVVSSLVPYQDLGGKAFTWNGAEVVVVALRGKLVQKTDDGTMLTWLPYCPNIPLE